MFLASDYDPIATSTARQLPTIAKRQGSSAVPAGAKAGIGSSKPTEDARIAATLAQLLDAAGEAIYRDRDAARACIARASAVLKAELGRDDAGP